MATDRIRELRKNPCIQGVLDSVERALTAKQKNEILEDLGNRIDEEKLKGTSEGESIKNVMAKLLQENADNKIIQTANALRTAFLHDEKLGIIDKDFKNPKDYPRGLQAMVGGIISDRKGARSLSTKLRQNVIGYDRVGRLMRAFEDQGVINDVKLKLHQEDVANELFDRGSTKNDRARKIADIIKPMYHEVILGLNRVGIPVSNYKNFIASMHRDPEKMLHTHDTLGERAWYILKHPFDADKRFELSYQRWKNKELQWLDKDKVFKKGTIDVDKFMRNVYDNNVVYDPIKYNASTEDLRTFGGLGVSGARGLQLFYKDGSAFYAANQTFGYGDLYESIMQTIVKGSNLEGLAEQWGTSPYKLWDALTSTLKNRLHGSSANKITKKIDQQRFRFDELTGRASIPVNNTTNTIMNAITASQIFSKLGASIFPAIGDLNYSAASLQKNFGQGFFSSYKNSFQNYFSHMRLNSTKPDLAIMGEWQRDMTGQFASRFTTMDGPVGMLSKGVQKMMSLNLIHWQDNMLSRGIITMNGRFLAKEANQGFAHMNPRTRAFLERYNITDKEWDVMRKNPFVAQDGRKFITPDDSLLNYSKEDIASMLGKDKITSSEFDNARSIIRQKLIALMADESSFVYLSPDIIERSMLRLGSRPGTLSGAMAKMLVQFHTWPFSQTRRVLGRSLIEIRETPGIYPKMGLALKTTPQFASILAGFMVTGYLSDAASNLSQGIEPPDPTKIATWAKASLGTFGIYGDFLSMLFGQQAYGNSPLLNASGPSYSQIDDAAKFLNATFTGQFKQAGKLGFELVKNNTLPLNIAYTRLAMNYFILWGLEEKLFPGSIEAQVRRAQQNQNPPYIVSPLSGIGV